MSKDSEIKCPFCLSEEVSKPRPSPLGFVVGVLTLGFPLPFFKKIYHCFDCGSDFKRKKLDA
jgi:DNA-directed RNA polymerase subunit RPC12/RpoP